jgi:hypothetical protein
VSYLLLRKSTGQALDLQLELRRQRLEVDVHGAATVADEIFRVRLIALSAMGQSDPQYGPTWVVASRWDRLRHIRLREPNGHWSDSGYFVAWLWEETKCRIRTRIQTRTSSELVEMQVMVDENPWRKPWELIQKDDYPWAVQPPAPPAEPDPPWVALGISPATWDRRVAAVAQKVAGRYVVDEQTFDRIKAMPNRRPGGQSKDDPRLAELITRGFSYEAARKRLRRNPELEVGEVTPRPYRRLGVPRE